MARPQVIARGGGHQKIAGSWRVEHLRHLDWRVRVLAPGGAGQRLGPRHRLRQSWIAERVGTLDLIRDAIASELDGGGAAARADADFAVRLRAIDDVVDRGLREQVVDEARVAFEVLLGGGARGP